jgi:FAD/FMN-containing dehydrogenase
LFSFNPELKTTSRKGERLYGGENFERLKNIKASVDPEGMFTSGELSSLFLELDGWEGL